MTFTRRQILAGLAGLGVVCVGGARYWLGRPQDVTSHDYELIAAPLDVQLIAGYRTPAWAYGGQAPSQSFTTRIDQLCTVGCRCAPQDYLDIRLAAPRRTALHRSPGR